MIERRDPLVGEVFDRRFRVDAKLAAGGFGAIYRATHLKSGHEFALKVLHPRLTTDPRVIARFRREGAALTRLRDPNTIIAYELGESPEGMLYIVMELLRGESLFDRYRRIGRLPWQHMLGVARAVCNSLAEAHSLGIIHRDLKPTNIHLEPGEGTGEHVKVLDFGIAKILQDSDIDSSDLTHAGQMIGTLDYMSPEQMVGGQCAATSDIYTLGIVMYEMIAGRKPFDDANSAAAALAAALTTTPDRVSAHAMVTPEVDHIVMRCLERQQSDRFQSAEELALAIDDILLDRDEVVTRLARTSHVEAFDPRPTVPLTRTAGGTPGAFAAAPGGTAHIAAAKPTFDLDATLIGHLPARLPRPTPPPPLPRAQTPTPPPPPPRAHTPTPPPPLPRAHTPTPPPPLPAAIPSTPRRNLRESYPTIHRPPPSPMRPPAFEDRPSSSVSGLRPFQTSLRPDSTMRNLLLLICLAIALIAALMIVGQP